jgi:uncharacterized protein
MTDLDQLLEVQRFDTGADQLRHRRVSLPERPELVATHGLRAAAEQRGAKATADRQVLAAGQDRLERDITQARDRIKTVEGTMYGGTVSNPRELQALQDEVGSLQRRVTLLEDEEIAVMEQLEPIDAAISAEAAEVERLGGEIIRLEAAITAAEAEVDVELETNRAAREASAAAVPEPLMVEYEAIRSQSGGVAVAALTAGQCGGCHMRLSSMELDRIKKQPADAVIHCEDCGRLLVR